MAAAGRPRFRSACGAARGSAAVPTGDRSLYSRCCCIVVSIRTVLYESKKMKKKQKQKPGEGGSKNKIYQKKGERFTENVKGSRLYHCIRHVCVKRNSGLRPPGREKERTRIICMTDVPRVICNFFCSVTFLFFSPNGCWAQTT